jgi:CPA1 family monovalent cation:H+ antiporter
LGLAVRNPQGILFAGAAHWVHPIAKSLLDEGIPVLLVDTNYRNVAAAKMAGLPSRCASIVSEYMEEIDLGGIGRLLAMTPNDDLNTLATMEFAPYFGRAGVYQLSKGNGTLTKRDAPSPHRPGRYLFARDATYAQLTSRLMMGAQVKKTKITEAFSFADFQQQHGEHALVLFVITESGALQISTSDAVLTPKPGQTIIALVDAQETEV